MVVAGVRSVGLSSSSVAQVIQPKLQHRVSYFAKLIDPRHYCMFFLCVRSPLLWAPGHLDVQWGVHSPWGLLSLGGGRGSNSCRRRHPMPIFCKHPPTVSGLCSWPCQIKLTTIPLDRVGATHVLTKHVGEPINLHVQEFAIRSNNILIWIVPVVSTTGPGLH